MSHMVHGALANCSSNLLPSFAAIFPTFGPADFDKWLTEQNEERAKDAADKIQELNQTICQVIFNKFRQIYGEELYWEKGVSNKQMKTDAYQRSLDDDPEERGTIEEYLNFIDYKKIVEKSDHWSYFNDIFSIKMPSENKGQTKYLKWMERINDFRKKTAHKGANRSLSEEEIELIDWVYEEFFARVNKAENPQTEEEPS